MPAAGNQPSAWCLLKASNAAALLLRPPLTPGATGPAPSHAAVGTEPVARDPQASALRVTSYEGHFVEIMNGQIKVGEASEPAYVSEPLAVAAHSPHRLASRATLGPLASVISVATAAVRSDIVNGGLARALVLAPALRRSFCVPSVTSTTYRSCTGMHAVAKCIQQTT